MFKANLEYGLVTYGDKLNKNQTNELMKLQKKIATPHLQCKTKRTYKETLQDSKHPPRR